MAFESCTQKLAGCSWSATQRVLAPLAQCFLIAPTRSSHSRALAHDALTRVAAVTSKHSCGTAFCTSAVADKDEVGDVVLETDDVVLEIEEPRVAMNASTAR